MATQTLEFNATTGLTISCKLFALESDTVVAAVSATEKTNDLGRYAVDFEDVPAGAYRLNGFVGAVGGFVNEVYDLTLATDVFHPRSELGNVPSAEENATATRSELATELGRIDDAISSRATAADVNVTVTGGAAGDGDRSVPITVRNNSGSVVPNAKVTIQTAAGVTIAGRSLHTDTNGIATFNLDDGNYKALVTTSGGYQSHVAEVFTVEAGMDPVVLTITASTLTEPANPLQCRVGIKIVDVHGVPVAGASVTPELAKNPSRISGGFAVNERDPVTSNANGYLEILLIRNKTFGIEIAHQRGKAKETIVVPDAPTYTIELEV